MVYRARLRSGYPPCGSRVQIPHPPPICWASARLRQRRELGLERNAYFRLRQPLPTLASFSARTSCRFQGRVCACCGVRAASLAVGLSGCGAGVFVLPYWKVGPGLFTRPFRL